MPNVSFNSLPIRDISSVQETLALSSTGVKALLKSFTGESGEYWVSIIPSLNVSGYGLTEQEAREDLEVNVDMMFQDLWDSDLDQRLAYLKNLGWLRNKFFKKQFSKAYVDENGVLQNFDKPESVKTNVFQAA